MFTDILSYILTRDRTTDGVVSSARVGLEGKLAVSSYNNSTVTIDTGIAIVDGKIYSSDAQISFNFPGNSTYYVVLRKTWATQQVRMAMTTSIVQIDGVSWDLPICAFVRVGGVITQRLDLRNFIGFPERKYVPYLAGEVNLYYNSSYPNTQRMGVTLPYQSTVGNPYRDPVLGDLYRLLLVIPGDYNSNLRIEMLTDNTSGTDGLTMCVNKTLYVIHRNSGITLNLYIASSIAVPLGSGSYAYNTFVEHGVDFTTDLRAWRGEALYYTVQRDYANAADTAADNSLNVGVRFIVSYL
jgi:hypothetical protein